MGVSDIPASMVPAASSVEGLVSHADVIVIGTIGATVNETTIGPYNAESGDNAPTFPVTDYQITVTRVLKDGGSVTAGDPLVLRQLGHLSVQKESPGLFERFPMSKPGDSRLFVLGENPDGTTYGLHFGPYSRFDIDGDVVAYSDIARPRVTFADQLSPSQLIADIPGRSPAAGSPTVTGKPDLPARLPCATVR